MPYIHFTDEQKERANNVDLAEFLRRQGERLIPSGRDKRLESNHSITVRGSQWYDHAIEHGGGAVSFVQTHYGVSYVEAVNRLLGGENGRIYTPAQEQVEEKKEFSLPPANRNMRRVYAYLLQQRRISRDILNHFAHAGLIYESCEPSKDGSRQYHNAVFVGKDEHLFLISNAPGAGPRSGRKRGCERVVAFPVNLLQYVPASLRRFQQNQNLPDRYPFRRTEQ